MKGALRILGLPHLLFVLWDRGLSCDGNMIELRRSGASSGNWRFGARDIYGGGLAEYRASYTSIIVASWEYENWPRRVDVRGVQLGVRGLYRS
jgi:hypothetical protein